MDQIKLTEPAPIDYPTIAVPGRGEFTVKFGLAAARLLDRELHIDGFEAVRQLSDALPREVEGKRIMGHIRLDFLFQLLSACTWKAAHMSAEELADAFDDCEIAETTVLLVTTLIRAISKTKWSTHRTAAPESATGTTEHSPTPGVM